MTSTRKVSSKRTTRRSPGDGSIRKMRSGRWQARMTTPDGRMVPLGAYATRTEASRAIASAQTDLSRGSWTEPGKGKISLQSYAEAWVQHRPLAVRTRETYLSP